MPVAGAGGSVIAVVRAEKSGGGGDGAAAPFAEEEIGALDCVARHCGSILQVLCVCVCACACECARVYGDGCLTCVYRPLACV